MLRYSVQSRAWIFVKGYEFLSFAKNMGRIFGKNISVEVNGDLSGNDIVDRISKVWKNSKQINSETVINEHDKEIPKERYISRRKTKNYRWSEINTIVW